MDAKLVNNTKRISAAGQVLNALRSLVMGSIRWENTLSFSLSGQCLPYYFSARNAGWPPHRCTERIVELAIADTWLYCQSREQTLEVGAVTPYYWPHRVPRVVDPVDSHRLVTDRVSLFDLDFTGKSVISISTLEHVGLTDYGLDVIDTDKGIGAMDAFNKIHAESDRFLATIPLGYNTEFDFRLSRTLPNLPITYSCLQRQGNYTWRECSLSEAMARQYGKPDWADAVLVVEKGDCFGKKHE